jgi:hypothetical protein
MSVSNVLVFLDLEKKALLAKDVVVTNKFGN